MESLGAKWALLHVSTVICHYGGTLIFYKYTGWKILSGNHGLTQAFCSYHNSAYSSEF